MTEKEVIEWASELSKRRSSCKGEIFAQPRPHLIKNTIEMRRVPLERRPEKEGIKTEIFPALDVARVRPRLDVISIVTGIREQAVES
jgi:hypothetical protein